MKLKLEISHAGSSTTPFEAPGPRIQIGRDPKCELALKNADNQGVSWNHALIELTPSGAFLCDLESSNGTFVNDKRVERRIHVKTGDVIRLGNNGPYLKVLVVDVSDVFEYEKPNTAPRPPSPLIARPKVNHGPGAAKPPQTLATRAYIRLMESRHRKAWIISLIGVAAGFLIVAVFFSVQGMMLIVHGNMLDKVTEDTKGLSEKTVQLEHKIGEATSAGIKAQDMNLKLAEDVTKIKESIPPNGTEIHRKVVKTNVYISGLNRKDGRTYRGSGSVVDREAGLILTAHHVSEGLVNLQLFYPKFKDGAAVPDPLHYVTGYPVKVIAENAKADLAALQVGYVPEEIEELPLANQSPAPGERLHTVGNPACSAALWVYTSGSARQVIHKSVLSYSCRMIEFQNPINGGDSGGPVVNDRGQLVGVNSTSYVTPTIALTSNAIDIQEIRPFLATVSQKFK